MSDPERHPATAALLRKFGPRPHRPQDVAALWSRMEVLAHAMADTLPDVDELTAGLRKLLEATDCFERAALETIPLPEPALD
jgi:hypothetical protein